MTDAAMILAAALIGAVLPELDLFRRKCPAPDLSHDLNLTSGVILNAIVSAYARLGRGQ